MFDNEQLNIFSPGDLKDVEHLTVNVAVRSDMLKDADPELIARLMAEDTYWATYRAVKRRLSP